MMLCPRADDVFPVRQGRAGLYMLSVCWKTKDKMADGDLNSEEYPSEIHEYLLAFEKTVGSVDEMLTKMMSVPKSELLQKQDPIEQAKLDLVSAYTLSSMFWVYLITQGVNPKEHPVKDELERIRKYMNRVKEMTDRKKAAKLDKGAAKRFIKHALSDPIPEEDSSAKKKHKFKKEKK
ncbi:nuclear nucleic acid-binding protein C1D [Aquarana catesbeiana]|uniref:nuclear nucleic acid-binding protein C1D n=1 Tax=Aquarana catesbeiana TaxID=8400 RepID=UPI003CC9DA61